jgi:nicotinamide-nucleotide adenylyltransferase
MSSSPASDLLQRVQQGVSAIELIYTSHKCWPYHPRHVSPSESLLRISVLDSSFNPPTLAHLALANSLYPHAGGAREYDAKLLLLSVRNAEKSLKPSDASYLQRLEMMLLLAQDIVQHQEGIDISSKGESNVAVAIIDEPTFVGKSRILRPFLRHHLSELNVSSTSPTTTTSIPIQLTFLQGFDTLERLFSPRFYHSESEMVTSLRHFFSPTGDDSSVVCARRSMPLHRTDETKGRIQPMALAQEFISSGRLNLIDIGEDERTFSSSEVRKKRNEGDDTWKMQVTDKTAGYIIEQSLYVDSV